MSEVRHVRARCAALLLCSLIAVFATATAAQAAVFVRWNSLQPAIGSTVGANVPIMGQAVFGPAPPAIDTTKLNLYFDGTLVPRMRWSATVGAPSSGVQTIGIYYNQNNPTPTIDGPHSAVLQVTDTAGTVSSAPMNWTVAQAPGASWVSPAPGASVYTASPAITMNLKDNTPTTTLTVSGVAHTGSATGPAVATFGGLGLPLGQQTFSLSSQLPTGMIYLTATVRDAAGNTQTMGVLSFSVMSAPAMTIMPTCSSCHTLGSHPSAASCATCHSADDHGYGTSCGESVDCHAGYHDTTPCAECHSGSYTWLGTQHTATSVEPAHASSCLTCHVSSLVSVHAVTPSGSSFPYQCDLCHASADPVVREAVATGLSTAGSTECSACHTVTDPHPDLTGVHADAVTPECTACHQADLMARHASCESCHPGGNWSAPIGQTCATCHPDKTTPHGGNHTGALATNSDCRECHNEDVVLEHESDCALCHLSADPRVIAAIADNSVACGSCHDPGYHPAGFFRIKTDYYQWTTTPGPRDTGDALGTIGDNPTNPGAHANYLATTAKCGMCHSVHRAAADGVALLPTADATCAGCHTGGTTITAKLITVTPVNADWVPVFDGEGKVLNGTDAGGGGGPHNDSANDLYADGYMAPGNPSYPAPSYAYGERYGCWTRRCHATNPHGANGSKYKIFAAKLLFNGTPAQDAVEYGTPVNSYGGDDAVWDALGATDASVERFAAQNPGIVQADPVAGTIMIKKAGDLGFRALDANETHALVAGLTCGRPSNPGGHDECHAEAAYAIVDKGVVESRNHATGITSPAAYRTDNTGEEDLGFGGNDNRDLKTGHVAGSFEATSTHASYAPIAGCTSCHDQTDAANTVYGNFTFPHGQTPMGATNLVLADGVTSATGMRSRIWSGYAGDILSAKVYTAGTNQKAYDGQCLKCHRDGAGAGIGLTH